jgi:O-antigen ligase
MFVGTILLALFVAESYSADDVYTTFFWTSAFILAVHFLLLPALADKIVYDNNERTTLVGVLSYAGLFAHKTTAGEVFALSAIVALPRCFQNGARLAARFVFIGSVLAIILAGAIGPLIGLLLVFGVGFEIYSLRANHMAIAFFSLLVAALLIFLLYIIGLNEVLGIFGRSRDFTGRDFLIESWPSFFLEHPILGYGFNGFFTGVSGAPAERLWELVEGAQYSTFESFYLELLIQFGLIGGIIYSVIVLKAFLNTVRLLRDDKSGSSYVPILILMFMLFCGIVQASMLLQNYIVLLLLFWIYFGCGCNVAAQRPTFPMERHLTLPRASAFPPFRS